MAMIAALSPVQGVRVAGRAAPQWDYWLLGATLVLLALGIIMVYSASVSIAGRAGNSSYFLVRQAVSVLVGLLAMTVVAHSAMRLWERAGPYLLFLSIAMLIVVLLPGVGVNVNNSTRWVSLGFVNLQPSEFVKVFVMIYVAGYLVRRQDKLIYFTGGVATMGMVVAVIGFLLLKEPDFGAFAVILITVLTLLFLGGVRFWHFTLVVSAAAGGMLLLALIAPYRLARVTGFLDPWADPFNSGFQLTQALIAFGRGEWLGVGLGASVQKLFYLPAAHTDFVFAVLAEELGLAGVLGVMLLFGIVVWRAFRIARQAERVGELYGARLAQGLGVLLGLQAMINMGVNMGVLPTKGLTLPLVSYGGSSVVASCIAVGLLLMVDRQTRRRRLGAR
jgi:cell division protein FtsW